MHLKYSLKDDLEKLTRRTSYFTKEFFRVSYFHFHLNVKQELQQHHQKLEISVRPIELIQVVFFPDLTRKKIRETKGGFKKRGFKMLLFGDYFPI